MPDFIYLDSESLKAINDAISDLRRQLNNPSGRPWNPAEDPSTTEVYIAKTPTTGISALVSLTPGNATCSIYQVVGGALELAFGFQTVYNLSPNALPGSAFIPIFRDKYGKWIAGGVRAASAACSPVTLQETELRCEGGRLNQYKRTITLAINSSGCPIKSTGAWLFDSSVASCESGITGTGTDLLAACQCPDGSGPFCIDMRLFGISAPNCSGCSSLNRIVTLTEMVVGEACYYGSTFSDGLSCGGFTFDVKYLLNYSSGRWRFTVVIQDPDSGSTYDLVNYYTDENWDCSSSLELTRLSGSADVYGFCSNWPATITVQDCDDLPTDTGTGTGTGAAVGCSCDPLPATATVTFTNFAGCPCLDGVSTVLNGDGTFLAGTVLINPCTFNPIVIRVECQPSGYKLVLDGVEVSSVFNALSCAPLHLQLGVAGTELLSQGCSGSSSVIVDVTA